MADEQHDDREYLPPFKSGSFGVVEVAGAIFDFSLAALGIPGGSALSAAIKRLVEKRFREAQAVLIEALKKGDLRVLTDPEIEEFVPIGFRFFQAARDGEARHIIETLASLIRGETAAKEVNSLEFYRQAQQLSGLSKAELHLITAFANNGLIYPSEEKLSNSDRLMEELTPRIFRNKNAFHASCSILVGRGLLHAYVVQNIDNLTLDYAATSDLIRIWQMAKERSASEPSPQS